MRILVACEFSGIVRDAFRKRGHDAWSCDIIPCEGDNTYHLEMDVRHALSGNMYFTPMRSVTIPWDLMIAHPPCTYLSVSGLHHNRKNPSREKETIKAIEFVEMLWKSNIPMIAIENPVGCLSTRSKLGKPTQYIQPYYFREDASKKTGLWLKNLPRLISTGYVKPREIIKDRNRLFERWSNQTDSGQNKLSPSETRAKDRSRTYQGIADAMAEQWGSDFIRVDDIHNFEISQNMGMSL